MSRSPETQAGAIPAHWSAWLHALWGATAQMAVLASAAGEAALQAAPRPILSGANERERVLHLPLQADTAQTSSQWGLAAVSHAAAHWQFGGPPQPRAGFKPVQLALFGVLEDARVEWLALQELPGLRALWLPFHAGDDAPSGMHFEALLARLARSLLDPAHVDPHPWVARARAMFYRRDGVSLALRSPADVRRAASQLGNDIGQMRLPFNARIYRQHAAYRDDNHHLWQEDETLPASDQPLVTGTVDDGGGGSATDSRPSAPGTPVPYPEWDHRIGRYRAAWAQVYEADAPAADGPRRRFEDTGLLQRRLTRVLGALRVGSPRSDGRACWGDEFHPAALVDSRVDQRLQRTPDDRVYRRLLPAPASLSVLLLLDASASTASVAADGTRLLDRMLAVVRACAAALDDSGHACAVMAFASRTRHRVNLLKLKDWNEGALAPAARARWDGLEPGGSTRTGAALRHATAWISTRNGTTGGVRQQVLLVTDGEPHDVDVHDPLYLGHDLRRAIAEAGSRGVTVRSLTPHALRRRHMLHLELARLLAE